MLTVGTKIQTLVGESASNPQDDTVYAEPGSWGEVVSVQETDGEQGTIYGVEFENEVFVYLDDNDLGDPLFYVVAK